MRKKRQLIDTIWNDPYTRDLYFGGTLLAEAMEDRELRRGRPWVEADR